MDRFAVIKGAAYTLSVTPDMVIYNGTTQTTERIVNPSSEYLVELPKHLRSFEDAVNYVPNQIYIGNKEPETLRNIEFPWYDKLEKGCSRDGKFGEILPEDEFYGLMQICDVFDLVKLEENFAKSVKAKLDEHKTIDGAHTALLDKNAGTTPESLEKLVNEEHSEPLYFEGKLVGCVKRAHDVDQNLSAHVMLENIVSKASCVLSLLDLCRKNNIDPNSIDYVIDCCEEACGDMNQRGGGNFAKAAAEVAGLNNATGSDVRGFCAGPAHAILHAASLVKAGTFRNVVVTAGGCTAKLGMNGKDHVKKGLPILEDCVAGFSVLISEDDGVNPQIRTDIVGAHKVGTGSAPQNVLTSLVAAPLEEAGLKITDIDRFSPELQNSDITKPAGAGDVPEANYKMIAALAVTRGDLPRTEILNFVKGHGLVGWAPTQGHIPSGVPYIGFMREEMLAGKTNKAMIIGKGSLFLGRMTNLFDGVSFVIQQNNKEALKEEETPVAVSLEKQTVVGFAMNESEVGKEVTEKGLKLAAQKGFATKLIEGEDAHKQMEALLESGDIDAAVTMHYPFPIGVSTVGKVITPAEGKAMYIATTTGTSDTDRVCAMVKNAIYGIIAAKADGIKHPTVGIANIDGARQTEKILLELKNSGYAIDFADSARADGGLVMRGNDLLMGTPDVMVCDSLTGNLLMKIFSSYTTGGNYESVGFGYGPGIGENYDKVILIVSRASGAPVIAGAVEYANSLLKNGLAKIAKDEFAKANKAGLKKALDAVKASANKAGAAVEEVKAPAKEPCTAQIPGIEVMDLEDAVKVLWKNGIYAESGMGCTGPVVLMSDANKPKAAQLLKAAGYIS